MENRSLSKARGIICERQSGAELKMVSSWTELNIKSFLAWLSELFSLAMKLRRENIITKSSARKIAYISGGIHCCLLEPVFISSSQYESLTIQTSINYRKRITAKSHATTIGLNERTLIDQSPFHSTELHDIINRRRLNSNPQSKSFRWWWWCSSSHFHESYFMLGMTFSNRIV